MALTNLDQLTADGVIGTSGKRQHVYAITLTPAAAVAQVDIYDGVDGTGTLRCSLQAAANGNSAGVQLQGSVFGKGIFCDLTGVGAKVSVEHVEQ